MNASKRNFAAPALAVAFFTLLLSGAAVAQDSTGGSGSGSGSSQGGGTANATRTDDDHKDYGWVGLVGLAGLAGLLRKPKEVHTHETRVVPPTTR